MADKTNKTAEVVPFVITCADEGVQINTGRRLGFVGAGLELPLFDQVVPLLKSLFGQELTIAASEESDWAKRQYNLKDWHQVNATTQQKTEALADQLGLLYAGYLPFTDPRQLKHGVRGHIVRPHKVHIANKISFTCGGGEQVYNLGNFVLSADWLHLAEPKLIKAVLQPEIEFLQALSTEGELEYVVETSGDLDEALIEANLAKLNKVIKLPNSHSN